MKIEDVVVGETYTIGDSPGRPPGPTTFIVTGKGTRVVLGTYSPGGFEYMLSPASLRPIITETFYNAYGRDGGSFDNNTLIQHPTRDVARHKKHGARSYFGTIVVRSDGTRTLEQL